MDMGQAAMGAKNDSSQGTYDDLIHLMADKEVLIDWLMAEGLIRRSQLCPHCNQEMKLVTCNDRSDGLK